MAEMRSASGYSGSSPSAFLGLGAEVGRETLTRRWAAGRAAVGGGRRRGTLDSGTP